MRAQLETYVLAVAELGPELAQVADGELPMRTDRLRARAAGGEPTSVLLPEAFALVREATRRVRGRGHHDVQVIAGAAAHAGMVAAVTIPNGRALTMALAAYLDALPGTGVHVVAVDDAGAQRDREAVGDVFRTLGVEAGLVAPGLAGTDRRAAYATDVTYGSYTELGYDYLRDNLSGDGGVRGQVVVQRSHRVALIDQIDAVLVDQARTPLNISGKTPGADEDRVVLARVTVAGYYRLYDKIGGLSIGAMAPSPVIEDVPALEGHPLLDLDKVHDDTTALMYAIRRHVLTASPEQLDEIVRGLLLGEGGYSYDEYLARMPAAHAHTVARQVMLRVIDVHWRTHLATCHDQPWPRPPQPSWDATLAEYRRQAATRFQELLATIRQDTVRYLMHVEVKVTPPRDNGRP